MQVLRPKFIALHILVDHQNVVGLQLVRIYVGTPPTHYYLESSGQVATLETHPYKNIRRKDDKEERKVSFILVGIICNHLSNDVAPLL